MQDMAGSEELREMLVAIRRENDVLRTETAHARLLLEALDALLRVRHDGDPFAGAFSALLPIFHASHAIVLVEEAGDSAVDDGAGSEHLRCIAANQRELIDSVWGAGRTARKVLGGRVVATLAGHDWTLRPTGSAADLCDTQPALYIPLGVGGRRGLLMMLRPAGADGFDRGDTTLAGKFAVLASHALARREASQTEAERHRLTDLTEQLKASQEELTWRANHDQLTSLPNRVYIQELVDKAIAGHGPGGRLALAFIDLDNFKRVNDLYGHATGDGLLRLVAKRIRADLRPRDVLGRISGDEFVILLDSVATPEQTNRIIERISARLHQPFRVEGLEVRTSGSIGVAMYPTHGSDYETLRRHADTAMYQAKSDARGGVAYFSASLGQQAAQRRALEHRLRQAVAAREFRCALQAKVDLHTHRIVGFEALVRWIDHAGQVRAPGEFIAIAGELGLLGDLTEQVLSDLIIHLPKLEARFGRSATYSINVSPVQAAQRAFMEKLITDITATGTPERFIVELTEDTLMATGQFQSGVLPLLRSAGIQVSIDDFGTGYSSLAALADVTADEIKVDRSLVQRIEQRPRSQSILRAIESLSTALGMRAVAEGIETEAEKRYLLAETRIGVGQGFLFARPLVISRLLEATPGEAPEPCNERLEDLPAS